MALEVQANDSLAEHPHNPSWRLALMRPRDGEYVVRPLGLINGLFGVDGDGGFIAMIVDADGAIERFERLERNGDSQ